MGDLLQILEDTPARPRGFFYSAGQLTDLDGPGGGTCTVALVGPDGTAGPAAGAVGHVATGVYDFQLAAQPDPTVFAVAWSGAIGTQPVTIHTRVEVLGGLLFTLQQLRQVKVNGQARFENTTLWPEELLLEARAATLEEFTRILWYSPVGRHTREVLSGDGTATLQLGEYLPQRILSASIDGTPLTGDELAGLYVAGRLLVRKTGRVWPQGTGNVVVEYVHGTAQVPGDGGNVALLRATQRLDPALGSGVSTVTTPDGVSYGFDPAGQVTQSGRVRHFGVPAIDSWLHRWAVA